MILIAPTLCHQDVPHGAEGLQKGQTHAGKEGTASMAPPRPSEASGGGTGGGTGGETTRHPNMLKLGLDRYSLELQGVAPQYINRLYHALQANAMAFKRLVAGEQERLGVIFEVR
jgi:hypothetical protein